MSDGYRITLLGERDLRTSNGDRVTSVLAQPRRFCLLAYLALAGRPVARSEVTALFWPESDEGNARNNLDQALHRLRRSLGRNAIQSLEGGDIEVPEGLITVDLEELLESDDPSPGVRARAGERVFGGWNAEDSQPLQEWIDGLRRKARERAAQLEALEESNPPPSDEPRTRAPGRRPAWGAAIPLVAGVALIWFLTQRGGEATGATVESGESTTVVDTRAPQSIAVLLPEVGGVEGTPLPSAHGLMLEIAEALDRTTTLDVHVLDSDNPAAFARSLQAIGEGEARYVRTIVTVGGSHVRINAAFVQSGVIRRVLNEPEEYDDEDDLILELPGRVAARVTRMVIDGLPSAGLETAIVR